mgnify:CR=1 FL=1
MSKWDALPYTEEPFALSRYGSIIRHCYDLCWRCNEDPTLCRQDERCNDCGLLESLVNRLSEASAVMHQHDHECYRIVDQLEDSKNLGRLMYYALKAAWDKVAPHGVEEVMKSEARLVHEAITSYEQRGNAL